MAAAWGYQASCFLPGPFPVTPLQSTASGIQVHVGYEAQDWWKSTHLLWQMALPYPRAQPRKESRFQMWKQISLQETGTWCHALIDHSRAPVSQAFCLASGSQPGAQAGLPITARQISTPRPECGSWLQTKMHAMSPGQPWGTPAGKIYPTKLRAHKRKQNKNTAP